jgi:adenylate kinase family enzyme
MFEALHCRTLIIGNSGAGKTTLGRQIAAVTGGRHIALDDIYWEGAAGLKKRVEPAAKQLTSAAAAEPCWVIEGVFGWLVDVAVPRATALLWLDLPWAACKAGLEARGPSYSPSPAEYDALVQWRLSIGPARLQALRLVTAQYLTHSRAQRLRSAVAPRWRRGSRA